MKMFTENQKLHKVTMAAIAMLLVVSMGAGIFLQYGSELFSSSGEVESLIPEEELQVESTTVVSGESEELLDRPTGGKETFTVLEIVPNETMATWGYFIGGMEPNPAKLEELANKNGNEYQLLIGDGYTTPLRKITNGKKIEFLESPAAYAAFNWALGKDGGGYASVIEDATGYTATGYFEYVGSDKGMYQLTKEPVEEIGVKVGGSYVGNFELTDLYNYKAYEELRDSQLNGKELTGYNYDAILGYNPDAGVGYFVDVNSVLVNSDSGNYVIDHVATKERFEQIKGSEITDEEYQQQASDAVSVQKNYENIIFKKYDPDTYVTVLPTLDNRYNLVFDYTKDSTDTPKYEVIEFTFNPSTNGTGAENIKFRAMLTKEDGSYYHETADGEIGEYEIFMTGFEFKTNNSWGRDWVWHQADFDGVNAYSTKTQYESDKILWTPSFVDASGDDKRGFYCRNTYRNNEWFKLLCLGISGYDGTGNPVDYISSPEAEKALKNFDKSTKIEILTVQPKDVTNEMIQKAEFIYIADGPPTESLRSLITSETFKNATTGDLANFAMARDIYAACINKDKAVMLNANLENCECINLQKLYKMFTMFANPATMAYFLPSMKSTPNNGLNYIDESTGNIVYRYQKNYYCYEDPTMSIPYDGPGTASSATWSYTTTFQIFEYHDGTTAHGGIGHHYSAEKTGNDARFKDFWLTRNTNEYINQIVDKGRWFMLHWYGAGFLQNIANMKDVYHILKRDTFNLIITNALLNTKSEAVIYVDEFQDRYDIFYQMQATAVLSQLPEIQRVQVYYDANGNGLIDDGAAPFWEAIASGETESIAGAETDPGATSLNYINPAYIYEGFPVDVKGQFTTNPSDRERCFIIKVTGRKNSAEVGETPNWIPVEEQKAVSVIIRDMFELN